MGGPTHSPDHGGGQRRAGAEVAAMRQPPTAADLRSRGAARLCRRTAAARRQGSSGRRRPSDGGWRRPGGATAVGGVESREVALLGCGGTRCTGGVGPRTRG